MDEIPVEGWLFLGAFGLTFLTVIVEGIMLWRWSPSVFHSGFVVYRRAVNRPIRLDVSLDTTLLEKSSATSILNGLLFKEIGRGVWAFRESMRWHAFRFNLRYTPVMRGLIKADFSEGRLYVEGRTTWSILAFTATMLAFVAMAHSYTKDEGFHWPLSWPLFLTIIIVTACYLVQRWRYNKVVEYLERTN